MGSLQLDMIKENDLSLEFYFEKVTFTSDPNPGTKIIISDADFINNAILLSIRDKLAKIGEKL